MRRSIVGLAFVLGLGVLGMSQENYKLKGLEAVVIKANDNKQYAGERGELQVPENRDNPESKYIELPFFRMKTTAENPLPPIFIFEGGPGDDPSALERLSEFAALLKVFAARSDVLLMDQRGNGRAVPKLNCPSTLEFALNRPLTLKRFRAKYRNYITACSDSWLARGRDLRGYNVLSMADDTEALRKALGYPKIMIFGGSFGSHHALAYSKRYPDRVDRILLDSPEGLEHTVKEPLAADRILGQLSALVAADPELSLKIPSFLDLVTLVIANLRESPVRVRTPHPETGKEVAIVLGSFDLQFITAMDLGRRGYRELPFRYLEMKKGDFSWLAARAIHLRLPHSEGLMAAMTDCTSATASEVLNKVSDQAEKAILGNALNNVIFEVMDILPLTDISKELNQNFKSDIPLVLICGSQDARTPLSNTIDIMKEYPKSRLLIVEHGSHDLYSEVLEELLPIMTGFLSADEPLDYYIPKKIIAPLNLRTE